MHVTQNRIALASALFALSLTSAALAANPVTGDFSKGSANTIRLMAYNVERNFITTASTDDEFQRIFQALTPDIIVFNEIDASLGSASVAAAAIKARLETYSPAATWNVHAGVSDGFIRNAFASKYPVSLQITDTTPASEVRGVVAALVDLPDGTFGSTDIYVMGVHMKSGGTTGIGGDHQRRQVAADAIIRWMADARTPGGNITLPTNTPMVLMGDMNVGFQGGGDEAPYHASRTVVDGDVFDEATYGPDSPPDWDGTSNRDAAPYDHSATGSTSVASPRTQPSSNPASRLDRIIYTDSVLRMESRFILRTATMSAAARAAAGLNSGDTVTAADHLPCVVDFLPEPSPAPPMVLLNEFLFNDVGTDDRNFIELINLGGQEVNLDAPVDYQVKLSNSGLPASAPGAENQALFFDVKGIIPPGGGIYVYHDAAGDSSGIASAITSALPNPLQRHSEAVFSLSNGDDTALALVTVGHSDVDVTEEAVVDAYAYAATSPTNTLFFRTDSGNGLTIPLVAAQITTFGSGGAASDSSLFRQPGNADANSFAGWTIVGNATPGTANPGASVGEWSLY